jgi:hypothetical protein
MDFELLACGSAAECDMDLDLHPLGHYGVFILGRDTKAFDASAQTRLGLGIPIDDPGVEASHAEVSITSDIACLTVLGRNSMRLIRNITEVSLLRTGDSVELAHGDIFELDSYRLWKDDPDRPRYKFMLCVTGQETPCLSDGSTKLRCMPQAAGRKRRAQTPAAYQKKEPPRGTTTPHKRQAAERAMPMRSCLAAGTRVEKVINFGSPNPGSTSSGEDPSPVNSRYPKRQAQPASPPEILEEKVEEEKKVKIIEQSEQNERRQRKRQRDSPPGSDESPMARPSDQDSESILPAGEQEEVKLGNVVMVQERTWPGINRPGGIGRVVKVNADTTVNVKYLLGGSDKNLALTYVRVHKVSGVPETPPPAAVPELRFYDGTPVVDGKAVTIHGSTGAIAGRGVVVGRNGKWGHLVDVSVDSPGFLGEKDGVMYGPEEGQKFAISVHPSFLLPAKK